MKVQDPQPVPEIAKTAKQGKYASIVESIAQLEDGLVIPVQLEKGDNVGTIRTSVLDYARAKQLKAWSAFDKSKNVIYFGKRKM